MRTPGDSDSAPHTSVEFGTATSASPFRSRPTFVVVTSMTGDAPVTSTVSASDAIGSCASIEIVWPRTTCTLSRDNFWKPDSSNPTLYVPLGSAGNRKRPSACDTVVCTPINAGDVTETVTPGSTAPCASVTTPVRRPWVICPYAECVSKIPIRSTTTHAALDLIVGPPPLVTFVDRCRNVTGDILAEMIGDEQRQNHKKAYGSCVGAGGRPKKWIYRLGTTIPPS